MHHLIVPFEACFNKKRETLIFTHFNFFFTDCFIFDNNSVFTISSNYSFETLPSLFLSAYLKNLDAAI